MDAIKGVGQGQLPGALGAAATGGATSKADFSKALSEAISKVNNLQKDADKTVESLSAGNASLHETMIAVEKAGVSFQLMLQVRNKLVSAYENVMRTQV